MTQLYRFLTTKKRPQNNHTMGGPLPYIVGIVLLTVGAIMGALRVKNEFIYPQPRMSMNYSENGQEFSNVQTNELPFLQSQYSPAATSGTL